MDKIATGILVLIGIIFLGTILGSLLGGLSGWVVGFFWTDPILDFRRR